MCQSFGEGSESHLVVDLVDVGLQVLLANMQEAVGLCVRSAEGEDVDGGEARLFAGRHKDNGGFARRVLHDGVIHRLRHGDDARRVVRDVKALVQKALSESIQRSSARITALAGSCHLAFTCVISS